MKKILLVALSVILILSSVLALAEPATYVNETDGYQISIPDGWNIVDRANIDEALELFASGDLSGVDPTIVEQNRAQIEQMDMMMSISPDGAINFNINYQDLGQEVSIADVAEQLCPASLEQMKTMFAEMEIYSEGDLITMGTNEYAMISFGVVVNNQEMYLLQLYGLSGTKLYITTFTVTPAAMTISEEEMNQLIEDIASSFVAGA